MWLLACQRVKWAARMLKMTDIIGADVLRLVVVMYVDQKPAADPEARATWRHQYLVVLGWLRGCSGRCFSGCGLGRRTRRADVWALRRRLWRHCVRLLRAIECYVNVRRCIVGLWRWRWRHLHLTTDFEDYVLWAGCGCGECLFRWWRNYETSGWRHVQAFTLADYKHKTKTGSDKICSQRACAKMQRSRGHAVKTTVSPSFSGNNEIQITT